MKPIITADLGKESRTVTRIINNYTEAAIKDRYKRLEEALHVELEKMPVRSALLRLFPCNWTMRLTGLEIVHNPRTISLYKNGIKIKRIY